MAKTQTSFVATSRTEQLPDHPYRNGFVHTMSESNQYSKTISNHRTVADSNHNFSNFDRKITSGSVTRNSLKSSSAPSSSSSRPWSRYFFGFWTLKTRMEISEDEWMYAEEPHSGRRREILDKHPEIKSLMGPDPWIVVPITLCVLSQIFMCWLVKDASWPTILFLSYFLGGVFNHSLGSAIHELGHNLAFGHGRFVTGNRLLSFWCNLPLGVPIAISYKKYHADHHRFLGHENQDVDIPTRLEALLFRHPLTKMIWLLFHPIIHSLRPFYKSPKPLTGWELVNLLLQAAFDMLIFQLFGPRAVVYMVASTLLSMGLHPLAGHFLSEHYLFTRGQATHSYYGPLNFILYNVGYHNEHHDFPYIPYTRLPQLRQLAPEYYDNLPYHSSWIKVVWDFIFDKNMGPDAHGVGYLKNSPVAR